MLSGWAALFKHEATKVKAVPKKSSVFVCLGCKQDCTNAGGLTRHYSTHPLHDHTKKSFARPHQCEDCKICYHDQLQLAQHIVKHHTNCWSKRPINFIIDVEDGPWVGAKKNKQKKCQGKKKRKNKQRKKKRSTNGKKKKKKSTKKKKNRKRQDNVISDIAGQNGKKIFFFFFFPT
jgi:hypothetical protein